MKLNAMFSLVLVGSVLTLPGAVRADDCGRISEILKEKNSKLAQKSELEKGVVELKSQLAVSQKEMESRGKFAKYVIVGAAALTLAAMFFDHNLDGDIIQGIHSADSAVTFAYREQGARAFFRPGTYIEAFSLLTESNPITGVAMTLGTAVTVSGGLYYIATAAEAALLYARLEIKRKGLVEIKKVLSGKIASYERMYERLGCK